MPLPAKYCFPHNGYEVSTRLLYLYLQDFYFPFRAPKHMPKNIATRKRYHCRSKHRIMSGFTENKLYKFIRQKSILE